MSFRMFWLLLLGICMVLFMDEGDRVQSAKYIRNCYLCDYFDGYRCHGGLKNCWKFNVLFTNRTCTKDNFYYFDRLTERYLYRYTQLSCRSCEEGMSQLYHDLLRETFCCTEKDYCNDAKVNPDFSSGNVD